jgi:hypothetical protein
MIKHVFAVLAVIGLVVAFYPPAPKAPEAAGVRRAMTTATRVDRQRVSAYYDALADVVSRSKSITTVEGFRRVHAKSLDEAFQGTDLPGKYPGLDVAIDEQLVSAIGRDNTALEGEKREQLVRALQKVAADAR